MTVSDDCAVLTVSACLINPVIQYKRLDFRNGGAELNTRTDLGAVNELRTLTYSLLTKLEMSETEERPSEHYISYYCFMLNETFVFTSLLPSQVSRIWDVSDLPSSWPVLFLKKIQQATVHLAIWICSIQR